MSARPAKGRHGGRLNLSNAVARRVRDLRLVMGWSQTQMAKAAGLSTDAVSRIERGERDPRLVTLDQIGAAVGCSLPTLLDFSEMPRKTAHARDFRARTILRLVEHLDPRLIEVVITLIRGLAR